MIDYAHLYYSLFNAITRTLEAADPDSVVADMLRQAQISAEEDFLSQED